MFRLKQIDVLAAAITDPNNPATFVTALATRHMSDSVSKPHCGFNWLANKSHACHGFKGMLEMLFAVFTFRPLWYVMELIRDWNYLVMKP